LLVRRCFFYDTIDPGLSEHEKQNEQLYLEAVEQLPDTQVIIGFLSIYGRQKGVDVQLAVDSLEAAWSGKVGAIAIASGDGDFAPLVYAIRRAGPLVLVLAFADALSPELRNAADRVVLLPEKPGDWTLHY
jgi:uncharacterized protein (TIGR00288 family)